MEVVRVMVMMVLMARVAPTPPFGALCSRYKDRAEQHVQMPGGMLGPQRNGYVCGNTQCP